MKATWQSATVASILSGIVGFGVLVAFLLILWRVYPCPEGASEHQIKLVWFIHVLSEKLFGYLVLALCAIGAAVPLRRNWRIGLGAAIGSGLAYQTAAILTYITRFGLPAYTENNPFWSTIGTTIAISALFGFFAVWGSYRCEQKQRRANKAVEATADPSQVER
jgi:hypothetical protein